MRKTPATVRVAALSTSVLIAATALLGGCTSMGRLDADTKAPSNRESVFVFGVTPDNHRIYVFPGHVEKGMFFQNQFRPAAVFGAAKNGYVVGKAAAGDVLAITSVRVVREATDTLGEDFTPCGAAKTIVFEAPRGGVIYLGNLEYQFAGTELTVRYGQDFQAARNYIDANYPALKGQLLQATFQLLPVATGCSAVGGTIYIPVYLPRR